MGGLVACGNVSFVERVAIVNETVYDASVAVSGDEGGWLGLTTVTAQDTREVREVIDQGETWTFRFSYGRHDPVELRVSRDELADSDWVVEVPVEFEENLRDEGVPPPP